jgi:pimeloyl-ACP methyl ester carboxylesterase
MTDAGVNRVDFDVTRIRDALLVDAEFQLAARHWTAVVRFEKGSDAYELVVDNGRVASFGTATPPSRTCDILVAASEEAWAELLAPIPRAGFTDLWSARLTGFRIDAPILDLAPHFMALRRFVGVLRMTVNGRPAAKPVADVDRIFDAAVGRYVYIRLDGVQYRVYFEESGQGIPMLLQHTAGADGRQWRHLLEDEQLRSQFRMIAYDLPFHGRSLPPPGVEWWSQPYVLTREFLMDTVVALAHALGLDRPVFMGCSIGGHLAPDLALYRPDEFRAVVGINAGLATPPPDDRMADTWTHPRIHDEWKAAVMFAYTSPLSPEAYRRETGWVYSQGGPGVLAGDVYYYGRDHDLTEADAARIDTSKVGVYLLTGEYDALAGDKGTRRLAASIPGAKFVLMPGIGHFGPAEDPERFGPYLAPVLTEIASSFP